jgi:hypothetical protein
VKSSSVGLLHFPYQIWVSRLWGLPRFTLLLLASSSLWHLGDSDPLGTFIRRYALPRTQAYLLTWRNHYGHHRPCEHGLSSTLAGSDRLGRNSISDLPFQIVDVIAFAAKEILEGSNALDVCNVLRSRTVSGLNTL